ncbi:tRNA preQ1(34) S-adenosylmethionine ribosyltransferase-isomerase QueA [Candidatus Falkowbacteria bacterium CG02_land_8_20_14_3_00_36_14]|uniref:S-adenosylmethionine:tRNA ribosyltransferase-isomerase n=1 Tax=Candidatus Falkowbacteria bacterium CG02_land_8_20_14_3_00_36_14 TaxID=1974560 RepID=A0A2M7DR04_9BACT|nr:MAG: tRNA preQ1(34) S-adenosylmethionine ribosyltransferase-isomerase QueA [Candidatus Falkowbacteria bacterium CG02_land_8_20_14_3_00_36_14]
MKLSDFDYYLPKNLIAQEPIKPRDHSRLLVLDKISGRIKHKHFFDLVDYLRAGDVLVLNNAKVFPARLIGKKEGTGGKMEILLLRKIIPPSPRLALAPAKRAFVKGAKEEVWQCLIGGRGAKEKLEIKFFRGLKCKITKNNHNGTWQINFNRKGKKLLELINKIGQTPLPPYIKRNKLLRRDSSSRVPRIQNDVMDYQTIYADDKKIGSAAAPTAGFHFTCELLERIKNKGARIEFITLFVGLGTFAPVKIEDIAKHKMHAELVEIKKEAARRIIKAKKEKRRIIAVGTTSARALESVLGSNASQSETLLPRMKNYKKWTNIFIYPPYKFKVVDAMITNFHLPQSTLLMLVGAFAGKKNIDKAYQQAIKKKYRFYSYGDAMFVY